MASRAVESPPGLDTQAAPESATASRERRRVALAVRAAWEELGPILNARFDALEATMERIERKVACAPGSEQCDQKSLEANLSCMTQKISRLEALVVCLPSPSVDEVLEQMLEGKSKVISNVSAPLYPVTEPENERSPEKMVTSRLASRDCTNKANLSVSHARTLSFDMFDGNSELGSASEYSYDDSGVKKEFRQTSWQRLAEDALSHSRLAYIRAMVAAPASGGAMVSRSRRCSNSCSNSISSSNSTKSDYVTEEEEQVAEDGVSVGVRRVGGISQLSCWGTFASGALSQAKSDELAMYAMSQFYHVGAGHRLKRLAFKVWQFVTHRRKSSPQMLQELRGAMRQ